MFALARGLYRVNAGFVEPQRELDSEVYDMAVDDTHLYLGYLDRIERLPLSNLAGGTPETVLADAEEYLGGIWVDDTNIYWAESTYVGSIRYMPK